MVSEYRHDFIPVLNMEFLATDILAILFVITIFAGFIDSIAGGGGLITLPFLFWAGLPPLEVLATNKVQGIGSTAMSSYQFARKGLVNLKFIFPAFLCSASGAYIGALTVQMIDVKILEMLIPYFLVLVSLYFYFAKKLKPSPHEKTAIYTQPILYISLLIGFCIGFYDGLFGPGTGSFMTAAFIAFCSFSVLQATAHTKLLNFASNLGAILLFLPKGYIIWHVGLIMIIGQLIGSYFGSRLAISKGTRLIRPLLVIVSLTMTITLILKNHF